MTFPINDTVGAWVPHGRFQIDPTAAGPLSGLRFAAKDVFDVAGHPTGAGNPTWLATHPVPTTHADIIDTLLSAGATLMGKVLTDELAYSLHGENAHYGTPINARYPERVPGGSSSGSAAAVGARLVDFALGTDTGGSTRVPASYGGLWGLRTTHGLLSKQGLVPLSPGFDTATWLAHGFDTFERVGQAMLPATAWAPARLLVPTDAWALTDAVFAEPLARVRDVLATHLGTVPEFVRAAGETPLDEWRQIYNTAGAFEAWHAHGAWITEHQPVFGDAITGRWKVASTVSDEVAAQTWAKQAQIRAQVRGWLGEGGVAVVPSAASLAPRRDAAPADVDAVRLRTMCITCIAGLSGLPQVSMPIETAEGDVVGISLLGPVGSDLALIRLAGLVQAMARPAVERV
jgi:amidase